MTCNCNLYIGKIGKRAVPDCRYFTWQVGLGAAGGEGAGDAEDDGLPGGGQLGEVDLLVGGALEEVDGGDSISNLPKKNKKNKK